MNRVFLSGNLTRDPEIRYTQSGKAYAKMGIAINRRYKEQESVDFFNLTAWDKTAEFCGHYLAKGSRVLVEGQLRTSSYENKDGIKINSVDVWVDNIEFAGSKRSNAEESNDGKYPSQQQSEDNYSNKRESASSKKNDLDDDFDGESIDPDDTPF